jgi:hypothetical protein
MDLCCCPCTSRATGHTFARIMEQKIAVVVGGGGGGGLGGLLSICFAFEPACMFTNLRCRKAVAVGMSVVRPEIVHGGLVSPWVACIPARRFTNLCCRKAVAVRISRTTCVRAFTAVKLAPGSCWIYVVIEPACLFVDHCCRSAVAIRMSAIPASSVHCRPHRMDC